VIQKVIQTLAWKEAPVQAIGLFEKKTLCGGTQKVRINAAINLQQYLEAKCCPD
jgi:hypothetical protein